eukprot:m.157537 g.157537  ORF g.157537 m.157537 type:complete len:441 (+) comp10231_c3_seq1:351-1673(+)
MDELLLLNDIGPTSSSSTDKRTNDDDYAGEAPHAAATGMSWYECSFMMTAIVLGIGVLGIPWALSTMGFFLGMGFLFFSALGAVFSGIWISRVVNTVAQRGLPSETYSDLGFAAYGNLGRSLTQNVQYAFLAGVIIAVQLTAAQSLKQVLGGDVCLTLCNLIIALVVLPFMQIRQTSEVTWVAILGVIMIIAPLVIYMSELYRPKDADTPSAGFPKSTSGFDPFVNGLTTIVFAYQGQTIFPELIANMKDRSTFPRAVYTSTGFMTTVYAIVGIVGYSIMGSGAMYIIDFVDEHDGSSVKTSVANVMLILHVLSGYVINGNVMNHALNDRFNSGRLHESRVAWFGVTVVTVCVSFTLSNLLPNLGDLIGVLGASCGYTLTFVFPVLFALKLIDERLTARERMTHYCVLALTVVTIILSTYATLKTLIDNYRDESNPPFHC